MSLIKLPSWAADAMHAHKIPEQLTDRRKWGLKEIIFVDAVDKNRNSSWVPSNFRSLAG